MKPDFGTLISNGACVQSIFEIEVMLFLTLYPHDRDFQNFVLSLIIINSV